MVVRINRLPFPRTFDNISGDLSVDTAEGDGDEPRRRPSPYVAQLGVRYLRSPLRRLIPHAHSLPTLLT